MDKIQDINVNFLNYSKLIAINTKIQDVNGKFLIWKSPFLVPVYYYISNCICVSFKNTFFLKKNTSN